MGGVTRSWEMNVVDIMDKRFFDKSKPWTYFFGGKGDNTYTRIYDGKTVTGPGIDCSNLVHQTMLQAGYNVDYAATADMRKILNGASSYDYAKVDDYRNIRSGDVLVFNHHAGVVRQYDPVTGIGVYSGSQNKDIGLQQYVAFTTNPNTSQRSLKVNIDGGIKELTIGFGRSRNPLFGVLRVKEDVYDPGEAKEELDTINRNIDAGLSGAKKSPYYRKSEPTSLLEGDSGLPGVSINNDGDGITVIRPFA